MACHWVYDKEVPGGRFWLPECWGGLYEPSGCYCPRPKHSTEDELKALIVKLTKRVDELENRLPINQEAPTD